MDPTRRVSIKDEIPLFQISKNPTIQLMKTELLHNEQTYELQQQEKELCVKDSSCDSSGIFSCENCPKNCLEQSRANKDKVGGLDPMTVRSNLCPSKLCRSISMNNLGGSVNDRQSSQVTEEKDSLQQSAAGLSSSLSEINSVPTTPLRGYMQAFDAKQKNYLFGGLTSLLGASELKRYFPDRIATIFVATWNMNEKEAPVSLDDFLLPDDMECFPDLYVIGTQESNGNIHEFEVRLQTAIGPSHVLFTAATFGILHLCIFLRRDLVWFCSVPEDCSYSLRPGTYWKTKGALAVSFQFFGTRLLFVNTHFFAHEEKLAQRVINYKNVIANIDLPKNLRTNKFLRHKDVTKRFDAVFWLGDLNFRLVGNRESILEQIGSAVKPEDYHQLLQYDQLNQEKKKGVLLHGFEEGKIGFAPTFKYDVGTDVYDSSYKQRIPSYTDRIFFRTNRDPIKCLRYGSCPLFKTSDHKPVWGIYNIKVRPGKDDVPLAAGLFQRDVYLEALKRRRRLFHQASSKNCKVQ